MRSILASLILVLTLAWSLGQARADVGPVWPPPPAEARVVWVGELDCASLEKHRGFLGRVARIVGGGSEGEKVGLPFDLLVDGETVYMTCQDFPALIAVDPEKGKFRIFECKDRPMVTPVAVAGGGQAVYVSDSSQGVVYRLAGDRFEPWVTKGLVRPTGLACSSDGKMVYVVDTGDHSLKIFDVEGEMVKEPLSRGEGDAGLNFPTFAAVVGREILVNDTLNYQIKRLDREGNLLASFGQEGVGPGTFARPKGVAVDHDGNVWVVDALSDNIQIFDESGRLLLVVGGRGRGKGEFWSPSGIAFDGDLVYVADTFNNRIQILRYIGGGS